MTDEQIAEQLAKEFGFVIEPVFLAGNRRPDCFRIVWEGSGCTPATKTEVTLWTALLARERELRRVRAELLDWENREAAVCPEDVGFEELITVLREKLRRSCEALKDATMHLHLQHPRNGRTIEPLAACEYGPCVAAREAGE